MGNWRHIFKNLLLWALTFWVVNVSAQEPKLERAGQLMRAQKYAEAARAIDSAIVHPETTRDFITWTTRAYIYYYIYIKTDRNLLESNLRDTVLISVRKSITLNPDSDYVKNNQNLLNNVASHYWNISKHLLEDSVNSTRSLIAYNKYKELLRLADANSAPDSRDVEYFGVVGSIFSDIFNKDNKNQAAGTTAKVALMKVLDLQPDNFSANMNMGLLYLNQAVNIVREMDEVELDQIDEIQNNIVKLARQAEQFMLRAYKIDPKSRKANTALFYIYRMLYDIPKSDEYRKKAEDLGEKFEVETNNKQSGQK